MNPFQVISNFQGIGTILLDISIFLGVGLIFGAIFSFKRYGETRTYMSSQMSISGPMFMMLAGTLLLVLPVTLNTLNFNIWGAASDIGYYPTDLELSGYAQMVLVFVRLIGVGAAIRGLHLLSRHGHSQHQGMLGKAMLHIIGGSLCIHAVGTSHLLSNIFDLPTFS